MSAVKTCRLCWCDKDRHTIQWFNGAPFVECPEMPTTEARVAADLDRASHALPFRPPPGRQP